MGYQNKLLFRESLRDTGAIPTHDSIYWSPDIICHEQVANPKTFFTGNYGQDVSQLVNLGTVNNFIYTRVKNLSTDNTPVTGYINIYRSQSSLFMQPTLWSKTPLVTAANRSCIQVSSSTPGEVLVDNDDFFLLSGLDNNLFCMMGVVSDSPTPTYPATDFVSYDDFVYWLRTNPSVCARNLSLEYNCRKLAYERLDAFSNPEQTEVKVFFDLEATGMYDKTVFGIVCEPLGIRQEAAFDASKERNELSVVSYVPPEFSGFVKCYAVLPAGKTEWPSEGHIRISPYTPMNPNHKSYRFAVEPRATGINALHLRSLPPIEKLVQLGCCQSRFI